ncbi:MAG: thioredoxin family protein [Acidobacteriota bacterium]|nr:MAG: thioredoxin family protein [Acidobacteriota bacterium]
MNYTIHPIFAGLLPFFLFCVLMSPLNASSEEAATGEAQWMTSLDEALTQAAEVGKPVFVDFWAIWCGYCKDLEAAFRTPDFSQVLEGFVLARIDFDVEKDWVARYGIRTLPTTLVLGENGEVIMRSVGRTPTRILLQRTRTAAAGYPVYRNELSDREDVEVLRRRAEYLLYSGNPFASLENLKIVLTKIDRNDTELKEEVFFSVGLCLIALRDFPSAREIFTPLAQGAETARIKEDAIGALERITEIERLRPAPSLAPPH